MGFFSHNEPATTSKPGMLQELVASAERPVLVMFAEPDSPACQMEKPVVAEVRRRYGERLEIVKADLATSSDDAARFGVSAVPTFMLFVNGAKKVRLVGYQSIDELTEAIDSALPPARAETPAPEAPAAP